MLTKKRINSFIAASISLIVAFTMVFSFLNPSGALAAPNAVTTGYVGNYKYTQNADPETLSSISGDVTKSEDNDGRL